MDVDIAILPSSFLLPAPPAFFLVCVKARRAGGGGGKWAMRGPRRPRATHTSLVYATARPLLIEALRHARAKAQHSTHMTHIHGDHRPG